MPASGVGFFDDPEYKRQWKLFNGKQVDPTQPAAKAGTAYFRPGRSRVLQPDDFFPIPGPHASMHMRAVPADYLGWINAQPWAADWHLWLPVADYLARYPEALEHAAWPSCVLFVSPLIAIPPTPEWRWTEYAELTCQPGHEDKFHAFAMGALGLRLQWVMPAADGRPMHYRLSPARLHMAIQKGAWPLEPSLKAREEHRQAMREASAEQPCTKHCHASEHEANAEARRILHYHRFSPKRPKFLRSYECPKCGFWHLTKRPLEDS